MSVERRGDGYRARIKVDGKYRALGSYPYESEARAIYSAAKMMARQGGAAFDSWYEEFVAAPVTVPTFEEFGQQYVETAKTNTRKLQLMLPKLYALFGKVALDKMKRSHVYKIHKAFEGTSNINNFVSAGSVVFKAAMRDADLCDALTFNPFQGCRVKNSSVMTEQITDEHHRALLAVAGDSEIPGMYSLLSTLEATGLRVSNVLNLRRDQVVIIGKAGEIRIDGDEIKNGITMRLPLAPDVVSILKHQVAASGSRFLWPAQKDAEAALPYQTFLKAWRRLHVDADLGRAAKVHGYRVAAATRAAEAGCTVPQLMTMFGWKTPAQAMRYVRLHNALAVDGFAKVQAAAKAKVDVLGESWEKDVAAGVQ